MIVFVYCNDWKGKLKKKKTLPHFSSFILFICIFSFFHYFENSFNLKKLDAWTYCVKYMRAPMFQKTINFFLYVLDPYINLKNNLKKKSKKSNNTCSYKEFMATYI